MMRFLARLLPLLIAVCCVPATAATGSGADVATTWRLLDYVAVDYAGAVKDHQVISDSEYAEMQEFAATAERELGGLPPSAAKATLTRDAAVLSRLVKQKASPDDVARQAREIGAALLKAYPVPLAPRSAPDLNRGSALYASHCAACHGANGRGDGEQAAGLDPRPVNFTDRGRAGERSVFALKQVIDQGLDGTAMASFAELPDSDRWDLAFKVGTFAYPANLTAHGKQL